MPAPALSVVIPTRDRPGRLADCLASLAAAAPPPGGLEVLVVDDGGNALLDRHVDPLRDRLDVSLLAQKRSGPSAARNRGAERARGRWLAFTDDDCAVDPGWPVAMARALAARPGAMVGGRVENGRPRDPYAAAAQAIVDAGYAYLNGNGQPRFFAANNLALPADRFAEIGGFDPGYRTWEDRELCTRWAERGWELSYEPAALVQHRPRLGLVGFWRQQYRYGRGAWRFARTRRRAGHGTRPDPRFYRLLLRHAVRGRTAPDGVRRLGLVLLAQAAAGAGFVSEPVRRRCRRREPRRP